MFSLIKNPKTVFNLSRNIAYVSVITATAYAVDSGVAFAATPDLSGNPIVKDINQVVGFLSAGVGIIVTGVIIVGGIQYMTAGDNPQAITAAKKRITNGLIALVAFLFMFAFLQWLVPGGVFG
jgi:hypothetical protein